MDRCEQVAFWDGFDSAILGVAERSGFDPIPVYCRDRMLMVLSKQMDPEDAEEHLEHNIAGAHIGPLTPMIIDRVPPQQKLRGMLKTLKTHGDEILRLRDALTKITENNDEPYARDFANDILERRED